MILSHIIPTKHAEQDEIDAKWRNDLGNPRRTIMVVGSIGGQFTMNSVPFSWRYYMHGGP